jgi:flagellar biosynthesis repressor protein FlbT
MALKVELKPGERILIGESVITNGSQRARFLIEGSSPILREKDIITAEQANTPAKRIYLAILLMYTARNPAAHHDTYFQLVRDFLQAAPSAARQIETINNLILTGGMYKALKSAKQLIEYEQDLIRNEECRPRLRKRRSSDLQSA